MDKLNHQKRNLSMVSLTRKQDEAFTYLMEGYTVQEIADCMGIGNTGAKHHLTIIYKKFGVMGKRELLEMVRSEKVKEKKSQLPPRPHSLVLPRGLCGF